MAVELTEEEAEALEKLDVVIEEDIPFSASALDDGSREGTSGSPDAPETAQEPGTAQEAGGETTDNPADTQTSQDTDSPGSTEGQEDIDSPEEPEGPGNTEEPDISEGTGKPGTSEETKQPEEPEEKEESEDPEETEEADTSEETEEPESSEEAEEAEDREGQRTQKEEARDDWNLAAVHADTYAKEEASGEPVKIAVLDSGLNYRQSLPVYGHETELKGMESNPFFEDATGHGTAVASLIASSPDGESIRGINKDAEVYSVQVLGPDNSGTLSGVVQGIYWAIENDMDIINMSFGTPHPSEILEKAIKDAEEAGILLVAAAGNDADSAVSYPAAYDGVCAVGSSSPEGAIAEDSTRGEDVDIYAPGETVMVNAPLFGTQIEEEGKCGAFFSCLPTKWQVELKRRVPIPS